jgi:flagella basal body P-ring formation protein FlgA
MLRTLILATVLGIATPAGFTGQALAQNAPAPTLKRAVTVASDVVRIGDLFDNAGERANIAVFRAPNPGETGSVPTKSIVDAVRAHDLYMFDTAGIQAVSVTHASRAISSKEVLERLAAALAELPGLGEAESLNITSDNTLQTIHVDPTAVGTLQITRLQHDPRTNRFFAIIVPPGDGAPAPLRISGTVIETVEAAILTRGINPGELIKNADVVIERRPKQESGLDVVVDAKTTIGLAAKRNLRAGQVLRNGDLIKPDMVVRNEAVTLIYEVPGIVLSARGKAMESGREGDTVNVLNVQTKRTIQGTVTGPGRVTVTAQSPRLAANLASAAPSGNAPRRIAE